MNVSKYYEWLEPMLGHPHWAVIPDVIDGSVSEQQKLVKTWAFRKEFGAPVWHLGLSFEYLLELSDNWPKVCLGSSGSFWKVGSLEWRNRMDDALDYLMKHRTALPWLHGLRMMAQIGKRWPLASADSVNVARNYKDYEEMPSRIAHRIDRINGVTTFPRCTSNTKLDLGDMLS